MTTYDTDKDTRPVGWVRAAHKAYEGFPEAVMKDEDVEPIEGSGNVFRDFGDPEADLKQAKAILAARIIAVLDERGLGVRKAASVTGFAAADFSRVRNADLGRFTLDRLMKMIAALDDRIRVTVQIGPREAGQAAMAK